MKITFKKLTCLGLALVTTLSLAACGGTASSPKTDKTTEPEETVSPLAGTWNSVQVHANDPVETFVIHDNGDMTNTEDEKLTLDSCEETDGDGYTLTYLNGDQYEFVRDDNGHLYYSRYERHGYESTTTYFFRESDYADYEVVTLTPENAATYLEFVTNFSASANNFGEPSKLYTSYYVKFKDGLGGPSHAYGHPTWTFDIKNITIHPNCEITIGETLYSQDYDFMDSPITFYTMDFCCYEISNSYLSSQDFLYEYTPDMVKQRDFPRITGAVKVFGEVYVPKGWNP